MAERLRGAVSPYLLAHVDNPVDWWPWSEAAFEEAARRNVPVFVSIGYATCHWCHVMARESFSDPSIAARLVEGFIAIKVDREEHPEVDAAYLAAAGAFTANLGWPLSVFATPEGGVFYAGTYYPPEPVGGVPSFSQVLDAVSEAWRERRDEVRSTADAVAKAVSRAVGSQDQSAQLPRPPEIGEAVARVAELEDPVHGGFGHRPKFPVAPVLGFLLAEDGLGRALAHRTLRTMGASPLRDAVEGGFFRYATEEDWSKPHYERMLYDNALLLADYTTSRLQTPDPWAELVARGIADFLLDVMRLPDGCFASAQDSESVVAGQRSEGGYYALDAEARAQVAPPALDRKVLTGWNGLAIGALAHAGAAFGEHRYTAAALRAADALLDGHREGERLVRSSLDGRASSARAVLEDYGMLAGGLLDLALATGRVRYAVAARELIDVVRSRRSDGPAFELPDGGDPVLDAQGLAFSQDPSEGAYPSGLTAAAGAAFTLFALTGDRGYREAAERALGPIAETAIEQPVSYGGALGVLARLARPLTQLVVVQLEHSGVGDPLVAESRRHAAVHGVAVATAISERQAAAWAGAGFGLFTGRTAQRGRAAAYLCTDFVCRLPVTSVEGLIAPG